jgi:peptide/nickel transport system permease protein
MFGWRKKVEDNIEKLEQAKSGESYWQIVKRQFKKKRLAVWSLRVLIGLIFLALLADFIANEKPIACKYKGEVYFPVFKSYAVDLGIGKWAEDLANVSWHKLEYDWVVYPPIPYSPTTMDKLNSQYVSPTEEQRIESGRWKHLLGTDNIGRDVLSGLIHGTRVAMKVGIISMSIASIIGILLGSIAGYFGDKRLKVSRARLILVLVFLPPAVFYGFSSRSYSLGDSLNEGGFILQFLISFAIFIAVAFIFTHFLTIPLKRIPALGKKVSIPTDILLMRFIEVFNSIPALILILSIVAVLEKPSLTIVMIIIGFISWTGIARFIRAELLKVRSLEYIEAAQSLGYSEARIIFRHAIPNALTPVLISIAFGVAAAILTEAFLSFLGVGVNPEDVTWGSMLNLVRKAPEAWWLAIFPGLAIFITVTIFNLLGEGLTDALDPKQKQ